MHATAAAAASRSHPPHLLRVGAGDGLLGGCWGWGCERRLRAAAMHWVCTGRGGKGQARTADGGMGLDRRFYMLPGRGEAAFSSLQPMLTAMLRHWTAGGGHEGAITTPRSIPTAGFGAGPACSPPSVALGAAATARHLQGAGTRTLPDNSDQHDL